MRSVINSVLNKYDQDWELSPKGKEQWIKAYFNKVKIKDLSLKQTLDKLKLFYSTDMNEVAFNDIFSSYIESSPIFISPTKFNLNLSNKEIQKIAFNLHNLIELEYEKSYRLIQRLFHLYSQNQWNYETFMILLNDYDPKLKAKLLLLEFKKSA